MRKWLYSTFIINWPRKVLSLMLATVIWLVVDQSLTTKKELTHIPIRIVNLPPGKTVNGIQPDGLLKDRLSIKIRGNKTVLDELTPTDIILEVDASGREGESVEVLTKRNLVSLNPSINISKGISEMTSKSYILKLSKLVTEKIPVIVTRPIGEAPKGYQFVDVWPYRVWMTVSGPEETLKSIKSRGVKLTFNLSDISKDDLDDLKASGANEMRDAVSYFVPDNWKSVQLPQLADAPLEINDPNGKFLRIDFVRYESLPFESTIPVNLYFPPKTTHHKATLAHSNCIKSHHGLKILDAPLRAKGVSKLFLQTIQGRVELLVIVDPNQEGELATSIQFINPNELEDRYVHTLMSDATDAEIRDLLPHVREEFLRNRFRNYMNRFRLYTESNMPLSISAKLQGNQILVSDES